jgi:hypothetical protein
MGGGTLLTVTGAAVTFVAGLGYARDTTRGRVRPNRVTWFVGGLAAWTAFAGQVSQGVGHGAVLTGAVAVVPTVIVAASFVNRGGYWAATWLDRGCLALALAAIVVLLRLSGDLAIAMGITARALGAVPTVVKTWRAPRTEQTTVYAAGVVGALCTLVAVPAWSFRTAGFAVYFLLFCSVMTALVVLGLSRRSGVAASANRTASSAAASTTA